MKANRQINAALLFGVAIVVGFVALGVSKGQQPVPTERDKEALSEEVAASPDRLLLEEQRKTNLILMKMAEAYVEEKKVTAELLSEMKKLNKTQADVVNLNEAITELSKAMESIEDQLDNSKNTISIKEHLEDIKSLLRRL